MDVVHHRCAGPGVSRLSITECRVHPRNLCRGLTTRAARWQRADLRDLKAETQSSEATGPGSLGIPESVYSLAKSTLR